MMFNFSQPLKPDTEVKKMTRNQVYYFLVDVDIAVIETVRYMMDQAPSAERVRVRKEARLKLELGLREYNPCTRH